MTLSTYVLPPFTDKNLDLVVTRAPPFSLPVLSRLAVSRFVPNLSTESALAKVTNNPNNQFQFLHGLNLPSFLGILRSSFILMKASSAWRYK